MDCKTAQSLVIPYIDDKLDDQLLKDFLDHIAGCKECYEELEIHFTIRYALRRLDENQSLSFNMREMLKENLKESYKRIRRKRFLHRCNCTVITIAEMILVVCLLLQVEIFQKKKIQDTRFYQFLSREEEKDKDAIRPNSAKLEIIFDQEVTEEIIDERKDRAD